MVFDPDKYLAEEIETEEKAAFDPDAYLAEPVEEAEVAAEPITDLYDTTTIPKPEDQPSQLEALGRGAVQGVTLGFGEEIGAGALTAADKLRRLLGIETEEEKVAKLLKEQGFTGDIGTPMEEKTVASQYREMRDVGREAEKAAEEAHPGTYLAGEIVGGVAPALATGGGAALASIGKTGLKQAAKQAAKAGAKFGAAEALGKTEADLTKGEIGEAISDVATGAAAGATIGGAIPVVGKALKPAAKAVTKPVRMIGNLIDDSFGQLSELTKKAAKATRRGQKVTSKAAYKANQRMSELAGDLNTQVSEVLKPEAQDLIKKSLSSTEKINITDDVDRFINKLDDSLENFTPGSNEANVLGNLRAKFSKMKTDLLKEAGQDPQLPTKKEAYEKLLKKVKVLRFQNEIGVPEAKAVDNLFNRAAKMKKAGFKPDSIDAEQIRADFNLADTDAAVEMAKDVMKLKIKKPKFNPKTGQMEDVPAELTEVIKKYEPRIQQRGETMFLERGPGKVRESEILPFRPDEVTQPVELTPQQLLNLRDEARTLTFGEKGLTKKLGAEIDEAITERLKSGVPEEAAEQFEKGMAKYRDIYDVEEYLKGITEGGERAGNVLTKVKTQELLEKAHGLDPEVKTQVLEDVIEKVKRQAPEFGEQFESQVRKEAKLKELQRIAHKAGTLNIAGPVGTLGVKGGALAGRTARMIGNIKNMPSDALRKLSNETADVSPSLSNFLGNLAEIENPQRRAALLFSAGQKSSLKSDLESLFGNPPEDEE